MSAVDHLQRQTAELQALREHMAAVTEALGDLRKAQEQLQHDGLSKAARSSLEKGIQSLTTGEKIAREIVARVDRIVTTPLPLCLQPTAGST